MGEPKDGRFVVGTINSAGFTQGRFQKLRIYDINMMRFPSIKASLYSFLRCMNSSGRETFTVQRRIQK